MNPYTTSTSDTGPEPVPSEKLVVSFLKLDHTRIEPDTSSTSDHTPNNSATELSKKVTNAKLQ